MPPVINSRHLFKEIPKGLPEPGKTVIHDTSRTIDLETVPLNSGFLIKTLFLSIDPYMRGKMRDPSIRSYSPAYIPGEPLHNFGVGVIVRSEHPDVKAGNHVYGRWNFSFEEYFIRDDLKDFMVLENEIKDKLPWHVFLGAAGMPGQTAYYGWKEYASPEKGDVAFITAGAGPVGSMAIQLAKADGVRVIASAGSDDKVRYLKELGADVAFNYKTTKTRDVLAKEGPINIYWDNVGGETLEAALDAAASGARFIECGMISTYNSEPYPIRNLGQIVGKCINLFGFLVGVLESKYREEFYKEIPHRLATGELKYTVDITKGLENTGKAIVDVLTGKNTGKSVILVAEE